MQDNLEGAGWLKHTGQEIHLVRDIVRTQQVLVSVFSRAVGVSAARLNLIRLLAIGGPDGVGVMALSRRLDVNAAAVTRQLAALESAGLVQRMPDSRDGRRVVVRLTSKGRRLFEQVHRRAHAFEEKLTALVPAADIAAAVRVLSAVRAAATNEENVFT